MPGSRLVSRSLVVAGILLFVAALRLDQAVQTAYDASWIAPDQQGNPFSCTQCRRLPSDWWLLWYFLLTVGSIGSLLGAVWLWRRRCLDAGQHAVLRRTSIVVTVVVAALGVTAGVARVVAARGDGGGMLGIGVAAAFAALVSIVLLAVATGHLLHEEGGLAGAFRRMLHRQRMNLLVVVALVAGLLLIGDTSGQAIDSFRTWTPLEFDGQGIHWSSHGAARFATGIAAAFLLALVLFESAVKLTQTPTGNDKPVRHTLLFAYGGAFILLGALLWWLWDFGPGIAFLGGVLVLIALLDLPELQGPERPPTLERLTALERGAPEWLATIPLLALAATSVTASVEAALSSGVIDANAVVTAFPALVLAAFAVLMTVEVAPPWLTPAPRRRQILLAVAGIPVVLVLLSAGEIAAAGLTGLLVAAFLSGYAWRLFRGRAAKPGPPTWTPWTFAGAIAVGTALAIAVHLEPLETGRALGTIPLALAALAAAVVLFNFAIAATLTTRPPRLLWWLRLEQLPLLSIALLWWLSVGPFSPDTTHDIRVVDRLAAGTAPARPLHPRPQLEEAFRSWVNGQAELTADTDGPPIPLVLVAAHGGGIRAAYWTALALDCIVGVSAGRFDAHALGRDDAAERERTCTSERRTGAQQQTAARRIFLASGVSGGAVGLYAYARQLLHNGDLGDGSWVEARLKDDFASPTVAWALFHDVPNRLVGYHARAGGACGLHVRSACWTHDRAAAIEEAFDSSWNVAADTALLRRTFDQRSAPDASEQVRAQLVPLLLFNTTLTGGKARGAISAVDLGAWPEADAVDRDRGDGRLLLAGTVEVVDSLCATGDVRLSTAALLAARFPYVLPSGHVSVNCGRGGPQAADAESWCAGATRPECEGRFVDGGYADNSGLFSIVALWPSLRELIERYNAAGDHTRKIAPLIIELDNHYQSAVRAKVPYGGVDSELLAPPLTALGGRNAIETYARAAAYRILPATCTVTIAPRIHPGLIAPLGWELSESARSDMRDARVRQHPGGDARARNAPIELFRQAQSRLAGADERRPRPLIGRSLAGCKRAVAR